MKKIGLLLIFGMVLAALAVADDAPSGSQVTPDKTVYTTEGFPTERVQTPTTADLYCAGFISRPLANSSFVAGGLQTPNTTKFANGDMIYLAGSGYQPGQQYTIVRELVNPNRYELFNGQNSLIRAAGQPYSELARVKIIDTRQKMAIAQIEFSCDPVVPGDIAIAYTEKAPIAFHMPERFDRFAPANGKARARIVMAKDFDSELGTGMKVYMNFGANQGLKSGDYVRAVRTYEADVRDPVDSLSFKASTAEDTQKHPPAIEPTMLTRGKGPVIHERDLPRRSVGEIVILSTTPTTATGMIVFALEDVHVGDEVEIAEQQ